MLLAVVSRAGVGASCLRRHLYCSYCIRSAVCVLPMVGM